MNNLLVSFAVILLLGGGCVSSTTKLTPGSSTVVDRSYENLTSFPKDLLDQQEIEELDISHNRMTGALPSEIGKLQQLRVLDASDNQFTGIPAEIGQLSNLEVLDFSNNQLTGIPQEIGNLDHLMTLDLSGNQISETDLNIIRAQLPSSTEIKL